MSTLCYNFDFSGLILAFFVQISTNMYDLALRIGKIAQLRICASA